MNYTLIRSSRRTLAIQIDKNGELIIRAPRLYPVYLIEQCIKNKESWIQKNKQKIYERQQKSQKKEYTDGEIHELKIKIQNYLMYRVPELWEGRGLPKYTSIKVTRSEKRWGSCSGKNGICFSYRLAEYLDSDNRFIDAVIVHELAHLKEKHHQSSFWKLVYEMMPDYEKHIRTENYMN